MKRHETPKNNVIPAQAGTGDGSARNILTSSGRERHGERGSALVYILIAIALLAALTMAFMNPSSNQTTSQNAFKTTSEMQSQADFIRSAIQECILTYPTGDDGLDAAGAPLANAADIKNLPYPIMPDADYLDNCVANPSEANGDHEVSKLRCPGNPGDDPCHGDMFGGSTGKFLPPAPSLFNPWRYYNGVDGVFIWTYTANTDAFIDTVLEKLDESFSLCEADVMAPTTGDFQMTSDMGAEVVCPDDNRCFRLWLKIAGTATYITGGPEDGNCP